MIDLMCYISSCLQTLHTYLLLFNIFLKKDKTLIELDKYYLFLYFDALIEIRNLKFIDSEDTTNVLVQLRIKK